MATSTRNNPNENIGEQNAPAKTWHQPTRYHQISATGRDRGYFIRVPHLPVIDDIARSYGPEMAQIWYKAALRQLTQLGQARGSAKDVAKTREAEQAAIEKAFADFAAGTLTMRGDDLDDGESTGLFNKALRDHPPLVALLSEALTKAGHEVNPDNLDAAFKQYYATLVERFGAEVAAAVYVPTKKGTGGKAGEAPKLELSLT